MILFIRGTLKTKSMNNLFFLDSKESHRQVHLYVIPGTIDCQSPILIADCELYNAKYFNLEIANSIPNISRRVI